MTFRTLTLRRSESEEGLTLETSALESVYGGQQLNSVNVFRYHALRFL